MLKSEQGKVQIPAIEMREFRKRVRAEYEAFRYDILDLNAQFWTEFQLKRQQERAASKRPRLAALYKQTMEQFLPKVLDDPRYGCVHYQLLRGILEERAASAKRAKTKDIELWIPRAKVCWKKLSIKGFPASAQFEGRLLRWNVLGDAGRASPISKAIGDALEKVHWSRGCGGVVLIAQALEGQAKHSLSAYGPKGREMVKTQRARGAFPV
jgi:hypothetical protein